MRQSRLYVSAPLAGRGEVTLTEGDAHYLHRVLRLRPGAEIVLFDGLGGEHHGVLESVSARAARVSNLRHLDREVESPMAITLVQGVSRGERMDYTLQKATELGVAAIAPVLTARSVVRLSGPRVASRMAHWRKVLISACQQCGRNRLPTLTEPVPLERFLADGQPFAQGLLLDPGGRPVTGAMTDTAKPITLLVGPEGGLDAAERAAAAAAGLVSVALGPRILRTETAAVVALSVLQYVAGDLGGAVVGETAID